MPGSHPSDATTSTATAAATSGATSASRPATAAARVGATAGTRSVEELLDDLQRESDQRRVELREIAAQLPAAMSRRAVLRSVVVDIRRAPNKGDIVTRAVRKLGRGFRKLGRAPRKAAHTIMRIVVPSDR